MKKKNNGDEFTRKFMLDTTIAGECPFMFPLNDLINDISASGDNPESKEAVGIRAIFMYISMPVIHRCCPLDFSDLAGDDTEAGVKKIHDIIGRLFGEEAGLFEESITAGLLCERGQLDKAHAHALTANAEIKKHFSIESKCAAASVLACVLDALGQPDKADKILGQFTAMTGQDGAYYLNGNINALTVRRKLAQGDIETAKLWLAEYETPAYGDIKFLDIYKNFTACRAYIVCGDYDMAVILLKKMLGFTQTYKRPLDIIETRILLAITYWKMKRGFQEEAIRQLEDAVRLAYGFGYTQLFVNESAGLSGMMHRLQKRAEQRDDKNPLLTSFIKMLYFKIKEKENNMTVDEQPSMSLKYTDKQKKVMKLLCDGKSNKEIAEIMGIKVTSLRTHIGLIYKKLGVTCEMDAVMKIKTLNIFEEL